MNRKRLSSRQLKKILFGSDIDSGYLLLPDDLTKLCKVVTEAGEILKEITLAEAFKL